MIRPEFDQRDAEILAVRQAARDVVASATSAIPLEGDMLLMADGEIKRVAHVWHAPASVQPTLGETGGFYLGSYGYCSFSGTLALPVDVAQFVLDGEAVTRVWFFHHGEVQAHHAVYCNLRVRRWKQIAERLPRAQEGL